MPKTALSHFRQDVSRAREIVQHADPMPQSTQAERLLRSDLLRAGWMFTVAGLDAYFCDAYTDLVAATIIAKSNHTGMVLPEFFHEVKFPIRAILEPYTNKTNWRWRMAARKMMERENVLSLEAIRKLFNKFFRKGQRLFGDVLSSWIVHPEARRDLFGIGGKRFAKLSPAEQQKAVGNAQQIMEDRFKEIFQRRHDCIHNCDRPRVKPQPLTYASEVSEVIDIVEFLVCRCDEHIVGEFRQFLLDAGCPAAVVGQVGY